ncbi:MAG: hypothetical protein K1X28_09040 [Parachlamydiales bacterium]|nr:hypothetical protein [Parachlamydiales bacterium]
MTSITLDRPTSHTAPQRKEKNPLEVPTSKAVFAALSSLRMTYDYLIQPALALQTAGLAQAALCGVEIAADLGLSYQAYQARGPKTAWEKGAFIATCLSTIPFNALMRRIPIVSQVWDLTRLALVAKESAAGIKKAFHHSSGNRWQATKHFAAHALSLMGAVHQTRQTLASTYNWMKKAVHWVRDFQILPGAEGHSMKGYDCESPYFEASCASLKESQEELYFRVQAALAQGGRIEAASPESEVYQVIDKQGNSIAFFKAWDKSKPGTPMSQRIPPSDDMIHFHQMSSFEQGRQHLRQQLFLEYDQGCFARTPEGLITSLTSDKFFDPDCPNRDCPSRAIEKRGYLQALVTNAKSATELHPEFLTDGLLPFERAYNFSQVHELGQVPLREFQKVGLLDLLFYNEDRNTNNILFRTSELDGSFHLIPIDHDSILPYRLQRIRSIFDHDRANAPLCHESIEFIRSLNPEQIYQRTLKMGLIEQAAINAKALAIVLKKFAQAGKTLKEIYRFASMETEPKAFEDGSPLWLLMRKAKDEAIVSLPANDRQDYNRYEYLRWLKTFKQEDKITETDRNWLAFYTSGDRTRIDGAIQDRFWDKFMAKINAFLEPS